MKSFKSFYNKPEKYSDAKYVTVLMHGNYTNNDYFLVPDNTFIYYTAVPGNLFTLKLGRNNRIIYEDLKKLIIESDRNIIPFGPYNIMYNVNLSDKDLNNSAVIDIGIFQNNKGPEIVKNELRYKKGDNLNPFIITYNNNKNYPITIGNKFSKLSQVVQDLRNNNGDEKIKIYLISCLGNTDLNYKVKCPLLPEIYNKSFCTMNYGSVDVKNIFTTSFVNEYKIEGKIRFIPVDYSKLGMQDRGDAIFFSKLENPNIYNILKSKLLEAKNLSEIFQDKYYFKLFNVYDDDQDRNPEFKILQNLNSPITKDVKEFINYPNSAFRIIYSSLGSINLGEAKRYSERRGTTKPMLDAVNTWNNIKTVNVCNVMKEKNYCDKNRKEVILLNEEQVCDILTKCSQDPNCAKTLKPNPRKEDYPKTDKSKYNPKPEKPKPKPEKPKPKSNPNIYKGSYTGKTIKDFVDYYRGYNSSNMTEPIALDILNHTNNIVKDKNSTKAFRLLSKIYHPDKCKEEECTEAFAIINNANSYLKEKKGYKFGKKLN
jgi:hypothetical protein